MKRIDLFTIMLVNARARLSKYWRKEVLKKGFSVWILLVLLMVTLPSVVAHYRAGSSALARPLGGYPVNVPTSLSGTQMTTNFSIIVLPDTQFYSESYPDIFDNQTQWIADNAQSMNTVFVTHEGDIVNDYSSLSQWNNANNSISRLDLGNVSYGILPGNHDGSPGNVANYNIYFNYSRFSGRSWYGGAYQNDNSNNFELFRGGQDDYLIFHFQYQPSDQVLAWANSTLQNFPNRRVIVTTHSYLNVDGTRTEIGQRIWESLIAPHADRIFLVLCGHNHAEAERADTVNGHIVYQLLADYQDRINGGNGWLRILQFCPGDNQICVRTYSPYLGNYEDDADSQFTLNYDMTGARALDLYVTPSHVDKYLGDNDTTFPVNIEIANFTDLCAFDILMTWDSNLLKFESAAYTTQLDSLWGAGNWCAAATSTAGSYKLVATKLGVGGASSPDAQVLFSLTLRIIKVGNFPMQTPIHFSLVKLSDSNTPVPNPIVPASITDGMYHMNGTIIPDIEMVYVGPTHLEYCKTFEIEVDATHIYSNLKDYDFIILYDSSHLRFVDVDYWGVLGGLSDNAHFELLAPGRIHVWDTGGLTFNSGDGLLFGLTFHVEFDDDITHIWRKNSPHTITAGVSFENAQLSFLEGTIPMSGITIPSLRVITIDLIRGDVNCDGKVNIDDISTIAYHYNELVPPGPEKYDLTQDGIIDIYDIVTAATNYGYGMP